MNLNDQIPTTPRSSAVAGLLGIFLGGVGAHNWYLGQKKRGFVHVLIFGIALIVEIIAGAITGIAAASTLGSLGLTAASNAPAVVIGGIFSVLAGIAMAGNSIWGLVEGIMVLLQGDAALAAKGYKVAQVVATPAAPAAEAKEEKKEEAKTEEKKEA